MEGFIEEVTRITHVTSLEDNPWQYKLYKNKKQGNKEHGIQDGGYLELEEVKG